MECLHWCKQIWSSVFWLCANWEMVLLEIGYVENVFWKGTICWYFKSQVFASQLIQMHATNRIWCLLLQPHSSFWYVSTSMSDSVSVGRVIQWVWWNLKLRRLVIIQKVDFCTKQKWIDKFLTLIHCDAPWHVILNLMSEKVTPEKSYNWIPLMISWNYTMS